MLLPRLETPSRATLLLTAALLIGGVGCYTAPRISPDELRRTNEEQQQRLRQWEQSADQGNVDDMVRIGQHYMLPASANRDKGRTYLERAAAAGSGAARATLGMYAMMDARANGDDARRQRGLDLLRQAALQGCRYPMPGGWELSPQRYLAESLLQSSPQESELWRARFILHCEGSPYGPLMPPLTRSTITPQQSTEYLAWVLLAQPGTPLEKQRALWPQADTDAALRRANDLRQAVWATEAQVPPPPRQR